LFWCFGSIGPGKHANPFGILGQLETKNIDSKDLLVRYRKPEMYSTNGKSAAGRTVVLSGFPQRTNTFHVSKWLQSKGYYPEDDEKDSIIQLDT
jgi:hypothetical protein